MSRSGIREKTVALAIAKDLQKVLSKDTTLEVHMTRTTDRLIPLWDRGAEATKWKGTRPGLFISIHCNSGPGDAHGFETYFLSDARTEHEKRVAANENAPLRLEAGAHPSNDLDAILHQLRNLDYQHWSSLLAEMIQKDLSTVSPGPDRGVKQAPLAVITNALMPAVLVEVGYLSNPTEARLLARPAFQRKAAGALADAVESFFKRYPPGGGSGGAGKSR
jgi:N-acetylmuramoyl-L-alanine amidase